MRLKLSIDLNLIQHYLAFIPDVVKLNLQRSVFILYHENGLLNRLDFLGHFLRFFFQILQLFLVQEV